MGKNKKSSLKHSRTEIQMYRKERKRNIRLMWQMGLVGNTLHRLWIRPWLRPCMCKITTVQR